MTALPGTQIDSVFICSGATTVLTHPSAVAESYADTLEKYADELGVNPGGPNYDMWKFVVSSLRSLFAAGTDPIKLTLDYCRDRGIEVFYSYRVNDTHATYDFCAAERSTWMRENPQYMMSTQEEGDKYAESDPKRIWSALDFDIADVREYLLAILEDVVNRYDLDGIEIDYFRSPLFFRPNLEHKPATAAQIDTLTGFQRRVREIAMCAETRRGRPMLVAARVPMTVRTCKHVGIDIEQWLKYDLLDLLPTGGGYVPFTMPTSELVELGHMYGVPVFPTISASGMQSRYECIEAWRGAASNAWFFGADGMYLFNHFPNQPSPQFKELGDPVTLAKLDKLFAIDNSYWTSVWGGHSQAIEHDHVLPVSVPGDGSEVIAGLPVGDDIAGSTKNGSLAGLTMRVQLSTPAAVDTVRVRLNEHLVSATARDADGGWLTFKPEPSWFKRGLNSISIGLTSPSVDGKSPTNVTAVEVEVKYI